MFEQCIDDEINRILALTDWSLTQTLDSYIDDYIDEVAPLYLLERSEVEYCRTKINKQILNLGINL